MQINLRNLEGLDSLPEGRAEAAAPLPGPREVAPWVEMRRVRSVEVKSARRRDSMRERKRSRFSSCRSASSIVDVCADGRRGGRRQGRGGGDGTGMERGERKTELMYLLIPKVIFGGKGGERE